MHIFYWITNFLNIVSVIKVSLYFFSVSNALCTLGMDHTSGVLPLGSGGRKEGARTVGTRDLERRWPLPLLHRAAWSVMDSGVWSSRGPHVKAKPSGLSLLQGLHSPDSLHTALHKTAPRVGRDGWG